jgi:hypothetical protein
MSMPTERPTTGEAPDRPPANDYLTRFFGGRPLSVIFRLLLVDPWSA